MSINTHRYNYKHTGIFAHKHILIKKSTGISIKANKHIYEKLKTHIDIYKSPNS
jgi:hypothetical protein